MGFIVSPTVPVCLVKYAGVETQVRDQEKSGQKFSFLECFDHFLLASLDSYTMTEHRQSFRLTLVDK